MMDYHVIFLYGLDWSHLVDDLVWSRISGALIYFGKIHFLLNVVKDISIFCKDWPEPDKLVLTALQFSNINIFIRHFCHPRSPKKRVTIPTRYFSPGPPATPPRCSTGTGTTTTGTSTTPLTVRGSPFWSTWPREVSCQVWRNIL